MGIVWGNFVLIIDSGVELGGDFEVVRILIDRERGVGDVAGVEDVTTGVLEDVVAGGGGGESESDKVGTE